MADPVPLRIALNATSAVTGGGLTYWLNMLPALVELGGSDTFLVLLSASESRLPAVLPENFEPLRVAFGRPAALRRLAWEQVSLPRILRDWRADVLLAPADIAPLRSPCPVVLAIRNPNPYWGPRATTASGRLRERILRALTLRSARRASRVFFVSEDSRRRIVPLLGIPGERTRVIYHGIARRFFEPDGAAPIPAEAGETPYFLCVSSIRVHKDIATLIEAFASAVSLDPLLRDHRLLLAGRVIDAPFFHKLQSLVQRLGLEPRVRFLGEVPYERLPALYRRSEALVFPSFAETFGHPLVEALAAGTPVVASDLAVFREVAGDAALYCPPGDAPALAACLRRVAGEPGLRAALVDAGRARADSFSWSRTASATLELLREAAAARAPQS